MKPVIALLLGIVLASAIGTHAADPPAKNVSPEKTISVPEPEYRAAATLHEVTAPSDDTSLVPELKIGDTFKVRRKNGTCLYLSVSSVQVRMTNANGGNEMKVLGIVGPLAPYTFYGPTRSNSTMQPTNHNTNTTTQPNVNRNNSTQ